MKNRREFGKDVSKSDAAEKELEKLPILLVKDS